MDATETEEDEHVKDVENFFSFKQCVSECVVCLLMVLMPEYWYL